MYKITWDTGAISYLLKRVMIGYNPDGSVAIFILGTDGYGYYKQMASRFGVLDKVLEPERKMFWLCYGDKLRTMGVIR